MGPKIYEIAIEIVLAPLVYFFKIPAGVYDVVSLVTDLKGLVPLPNDGGDVGGTHQALSNSSNTMPQMDSREIAHLGVVIGVDSLSDYILSIQMSFRTRTNTQNASPNQTMELMENIQ